MNDRLAPDTACQVVVTGSGLVSPLGIDRQATWRRICDGQTGLGPLTALEQQPPDLKDGGQAPDMPGRSSDEPREVRYLRHVIGSALREAGLADPSRRPYAAERCGLVVGTTLHGMRAGGAFFRTGDFNQLQSFQAAAVLERATDGFRLEGLATTTCSACSSGLSSIALGVSLLQTGELDMVIAGGYDPISEYAYAGFNSLRLVAAGPPRPFGIDREGMKLGEGYGALVLERADDALQRGAKPMGQVLAFGESADAHHLTQPHPEGRGAAQAIREALAAAELRPAEIDLIVAHSTGTRDNEPSEYAAFKQVFAGALSDLPIVAFKSRLGHSLGGAGTVESILALCALEDQMIPPTDHVEGDRLEFPELRFARGRAEPAPLRRAIVLSLGFGGANTCLVLGTPPESRAAPYVLPSRGRARHKAVITGIGVVLPGAIGREGLATLTAGDPSPEAMPRSIDAAAIAELLRTRRVRRMSEYVKLALASARLACRDGGLEGESPFGDHDAAIAGTAHGSMSYCSRYYRQIVEEGLEAANPMLFAEGVPNAAAAHLSLALGLTGPCQTIIGSRTAGLDAIHLAALRIEQGRWQRALICAAEEAPGILRDAYRHCGLHALEDRVGEPFDSDHGFVLSSGAVTLLLESASLAESRGVPIRGTIQGSGAAFHPRSGGKAPGWADRWRHVLDGIGRPGRYLSSANGTWIGGAEAAAIAGGSEIETPIVGSVYGHFGELFSVGPLAAVAMALVTGRLPALRGQPPAHANLAAADDRTEADDFAVLCTDYTGPISAVRIRRDANA